jgi:hypothetical protein
MEPLEVLTGYQSGICVAFLTEGVCAHQLEELAIPMDARHRKLVYLY